MVFILFVDSLKKFFDQTKMLIVLKKCPMFFMLTASTSIKINKAKFEAGCSCKGFNQFLL